MSEQSTGHPDANLPAPKPWFRPRNVLAALAVVLVSGVGGALVSQQVSAQAFGPGPFGGGWHGGGFMGRPFGGPMDPAFIQDRADRIVRHVAVEIDATADQQEKLRAIVKSAVNDLVPMRDKAAAMRERAHTLLGQTSLTRADIEALRTEQMALADAFTKRVAQALGDASDVVTPEQRKKLDDLITARRAYWHGWRRG